MGYLFHYHFIHFFHERFTRQFIFDGYGIIAELLHFFFFEEEEIEGLVYGPAVADTTAVVACHMRENFTRAHTNTGRRCGQIKLYNLD